jgi:hypothetical protein
LSSLKSICQRGALRIARLTALPVFKYAGDRNVRVELSISITVNVVKGAAVDAQVKVSAGRAVLISVNDRPVTELDLVHPHELPDQLDSDETLERTPIGRAPVTSDTLLVSGECHANIMPVFE